MRSQLAAAVAWSVLLAVCATLSAAEVVHNDTSVMDSREVASLVVVHDAIDVQWNRVDVQRVASIFFSEGDVYDCNIRISRSEMRGGLQLYSAGTHTRLHNCSIELVDVAARFTRLYRVSLMDQSTVVIRDHSSTKHMGDFTFHGGPTIDGAGSELRLSSARTNRVVLSGVTVTRGARVDVETSRINGYFDVNHCTLRDGGSVTVASSELLLRAQLYRVQMYNGSFALLNNVMRGKPGGFLVSHTRVYNGSVIAVEGNAMKLAGGRGVDLHTTVTVRNNGTHNVEEVTYNTFEGCTIRVVNNSITAHQLGGWHGSDAPTDCYRMQTRYTRVNLTWVPGYAAFGMLAIGGEADSTFTALTYGNLTNCACNWINIRYHEAITPGTLLLQNVQSLQASIAKSHGGWVNTPVALRIEDSTFSGYSQRPNHIGGLQLYISGINFTSIVITRSTAHELNFNTLWLAAPTAEIHLTHNWIKKQLWFRTPRVYYGGTVVVSDNRFTKHYSPLILISEGLMRDATLTIKNNSFHGHGIVYKQLRLERCEWSISDNEFYGNEFVPLNNGYGIDSGGKSAVATFVNSTLAIVSNAVFHAGLDVAVELEGGAFVFGMHPWANGGKYYVRPRATNLERYELIGDVANFDGNDLYFVVFPHLMRERRPIVVRNVTSRTRLAVVCLGGSTLHEPVDVHLDGLSFSNRDQRSNRIHPLFYGGYLPFRTINVTNIRADSLRIERVYMLPGGVLEVNQPILTHAVDLQHIRLYPAATVDLHGVTAGVLPNGAVPRGVPFQLRNAVAYPVDDRRIPRWVRQSIRAFPSGSDTAHAARIRVRGSAFYHRDDDRGFRVLATRTQLLGHPVDDEERIVPAGLGSGPVAALWCIENNTFVVRNGQGEAERDSRTVGVDFGTNAEDNALDGAALRLAGNNLLRSTMQFGSSSSASPWYSLEVVGNRVMGALHINQLPQRVISNVSVVGNWFRDRLRTRTTTVAVDERAEVVRYAACNFFADDLDDATPRMTTSNVSAPRGCTRKDNVSVNVASPPSDLAECVDLAGSSAPGCWTLQAACDAPRPGSYGAPSATASTTRTATLEPAARSPTATVEARPPTATATAPQETPPPEATPTAPRGEAPQTSATLAAGQLTPAPHAVPTATSTRDAVRHVSATSSITTVGGPDGRASAAASDRAASATAGVVSVAGLAAAGMGAAAAGAAGPAADLQGLVLLGAMRCGPSAARDIDARGGRRLLVPVSVAADSPIGDAVSLVLLVLGAVALHAGVWQALRVLRHRPSDGAAAQVRFPGLSYTVFRLALQGLFFTAWRVVFSVGGPGVFIGGVIVIVAVFCVALPSWLVLKPWRDVFVYSRFAPCETATEGGGHDKSTGAAQEPWVMAYSPFLRAAVLPRGEWQVATPGDTRLGRYGSLVRTFHSHGSAWLPLGIAAKQLLVAALVTMEAGSCETRLGVIAALNGGVGTAVVFAAPHRVGFANAAVGLAHLGTGLAAGLTVAGMGARPLAQWTVLGTAILSVLSAVGLIAIKLLERKSRRAKNTSVPSETAAPLLASPPVAAAPQPPSSVANPLAPATGSSGIDRPNA